MDIIYELLAFAGKGIILVVLFALFMMLVRSIKSIDAEGKSDFQISMTPINDRLDDDVDNLKRVSLPDDEYSKWSKASSRKNSGKGDALGIPIDVDDGVVSVVLNDDDSEKMLQEIEPEVVYVIDFDGDSNATGIDVLRRQIDVVCQAASKTDVVLLRLTSYGGGVSDYGLAASQLMRLANSDIKLVVSVDKAAASGGYMMACVADYILASPFALIGSIGVVAEVSNINSLLGKLGVDHREYTAGEFKRTVSIMGPINPEGEDKFRSELKAVHELFIAHVKAHRSGVSEDVFTGEAWFGEHAKSRGLIDYIMLSDEFVSIQLARGARVVELGVNRRKGLSQKLGLAAGSFAGAVLAKLSNSNNAEINAKR